ncbi:MAG: glycosyltransferase [Geminicoccaceae bacterium]|nr:glycosyltransferase [Geminicoccaceae bacterium]
MNPLAPFGLPVDLLASVVAVLVILVSLAHNLIYFGLLAVACGAMVRRPRARASRSLWNQVADVAPSVTVLVPSFNEEATIVESVRSLLALQYPTFEVVVVNDGSTDATLARLEASFDLVPSDRTGDGALAHAPLRGVFTSERHPNLLVLDKANGGKADALNAGINVVQTRLLCTVDADSLLEGDALLRAIRPFVEDPERVVGVGGTVRVANGCVVKSGRVREIRLPRRFLPLLQTVEYLRAFMMARLAWGHVGALMVVSGTFGLLRRDVVVEVGGYSLGTVGEDMEVIVKIHRHMRDQKRDYEIAYVPEPVCWTQVPETLGGLARQRIRWQRGAIESFVWHRKMLMRPRYGVVGTLGLGHILLADIVAPLVELLSYLLLPLFWMAGLIYWEFFAAWLALTFGFGVFISVGSLVLEELELKRVPRAADLLLLAIAAIVENFGYRQLNNFWRMVGHWRYLRREKGWGVMRRLAFTPAV